VDDLSGVTGMAEDKILVVDDEVGMATLDIIANKPF